MEHTQAFLKGIAAYWDYKSLVDNPYKKVENFLEWEDGYTTARAWDNGDIKDEQEYCRLGELMHSNH